MQVTESAKKRVAWINHHHEKSVRVLVQGGGCAGFRYDFDLSEPQEDDTVIDDILVDPQSLELLREAVVDFVADFHGEYFKVEVTNSVSQCGCGRSFSL